MVNIYGVFRDYCKVRPAEILYTLIATAASNLVFSWVFGSANSVTRPDRRNTKMVYSARNMFNFGLVPPSEITTGCILPIDYSVLLP